MPLKMCNNWGQKGSLRSYWYSFSLPLRCKYFQFKKNILTFVIKFALIKWEFLTNNSEFGPKIVENSFEIICILTAGKNYTSNFSETPLGHAYCTSSKASLTAPSNQAYFHCNFKIFFNFGTFFKKIIFIFVKLIRLWKWIVLK